MFNLSRLFRHLFATTRQTKKYFSRSSLERIETAIVDSETGHSGQIQVVIETSMSPYGLFNHQTPRDRAIEVFSLQNTWDTEHNNGVLIYLLMADHAIEIIADRGIHQNVGDEFWQKTCTQIENQLKSGFFVEGVLEGIYEIDQILRKFYPSKVITTNELSDQPIII